MAENYDLSMSKYKEDSFVEVAYEKPETIFERLLSQETGIMAELHDLQRLIK